MRLSEHNGFYVLDTEVAPTGKQTTAKCILVWQAGALLTIVKPRGSTVSPRADTSGNEFNPIGRELGVDKEDKEDEVEAGSPRQRWRSWQKQDEELREKVEEYLDDNNGNTEWKVPTIKAPHQPTKDDWERHQATHTPYALWCKHCLAARVVRHQHPSKGRQIIVVPDAESSENMPTTISIDYMYLHERIGKFRSFEHNPPQLVKERRMVQHGYQGGSCSIFPIADMKAKAYN